MSGPNPQTQSRFFAFPPELRNEIYTFLVLLACDSSGLVRLVKRDGPRDSARRPSVLSILQTCKIVQSEAEELFYSTCSIYIDNDDRSVDHIGSFIRSTSHKRLATIRNLTVAVSHIEHVA